MNWTTLNNNSTVDLNSITVLKLEALYSSVVTEITKGRRPVAFFGEKIAGGTRLMIILADDRRSELLSACVIFPDKVKSYPSLTNTLPVFHYFEREFYEDTGILPEGHPWLKPVRFSRTDAGSSQTKTEYQFYAIEGETIHEVAVGPVHAGVIEPGHFRFMCTGETVRHLEIQLGYQHRAIEKMFIAGDICKKHILAESIAGDSTVANATAYSSLIESSSGIEISPRASAIRAIGQELERIALHLSTLAGLCGDVGDLTGNTYWGATRTYAINALLAICGSRFGHGLVVPGGVNYNLESADIAALNATLQLIRDRIFIIGERTFNMPGILSRFQQTGTIDRQTAEKINLVGPVGRASGVKLDVRTDHPYGYFKYYPPYKLTLESGDVFARSYIRYLEMQRSLNLVMDILTSLPRSTTIYTEPSPPRSESMTVSMVEGPRGELIHLMITGGDGKVTRYKIKDPSFNNWFGLAMAVRNEGISDFPICNKSFDLSYCGHDL